MCECVAAKCRLRVCGRKPCRCARGAHRGRASRRTSHSARARARTHAAAAASSSRFSSRPAAAAPGWMDGSSPPQFSELSQHTESNFGSKQMRNEKKERKETHRGLEQQRKFDSLFPILTGGIQATFKRHNRNATHFSLCSINSDRRRQTSLRLKATMTLRNPSEKKGRRKVSQEARQLRSKSV